MKQIFSTTVVLASALWWCTASAGYRANAPLAITGMTASGSIGQVRDDSNANDAIFCTLQGCATSTLCTQSYSLPAALSVQCMATNGSTTLACTSTSPNLVSVVQAMSPDSFVLFTSDQFGINGTCTKIQIANGSVYAPPSATP